MLASCGCTGQASPLDLIDGKVHIHPPRPFCKISTCCYSLGVRTRFIAKRCKKRVVSGALCSSVFPLRYTARPQKTPIDRATGNLSAPLYRPTLGKTFESMHLAKICQKSTENPMKIRRKLKELQKICFLKTYFRFNQETVTSHRCPTEI